MKDSKLIRRHLTMQQDKYPKNTANKTKVRSQDLIQQPFFLRGISFTNWATMLPVCTDLQF